MHPTVVSNSLPPLPAVYRCIHIEVQRIMHHYYEMLVSLITKHLNLKTLHPLDATVNSSYRTITLFWKFGLILYERIRKFITHNAYCGYF